MNINMVGAAMKSMKTMMRLGSNSFLLVVSPAFAGIPQVRHISRLGNLKYCDKRTTMFNCLSLKLRTVLLKNCELFWHCIAPVSSDRFSKIRKYSNCYHTTCSHLEGHDPGATSNMSGQLASTNNRTHKQRNVNSLIETWFYEVCSRGSLEASLPFRTEVRSLHPDDYPDMNKVIIQLHFDASNDTELPSAHQLSQVGDLYSLKVSFDEDKANMNISCDVIKGLVVPIVCTLLVPLKFDLKLAVIGDNALSVQKMQSNIIVIENDKGDCYFSDIKSGSISALCRSGNITCKSGLLGNVYFHTGKSGSIVADKLQGSNIICETELGSVDIKSLYADSSIFRSDAGNIRLGQCHGQVYIQAEKSNLTIESLDGDLDVGLQSGSVDVHLSRHSKADIDISTGNISLSFPEGTSTDLNLDGRTVIVDKNVDATFAFTELPHHKEGCVCFLGHPTEVDVESSPVSYELLYPPPPIMFSWRAMREEDLLVVVGKVGEGTSLLCGLGCAAPRGTYGRVALQHHQ